MSLHIPLEDLSAHLDGALTDARAAQVSHHLADCPACRRQQAELDWARSYLRALPVGPLPAGLDLRLPEAEEDPEADPSAEAEASRGALRPFAARSAWWGLGAVAALLVLAFFLRPLARGLGLGPAPAAEETQELNLDSSLLSEGPASVPAASPDLDAVVGVAGTQSVDDSRGPTALAPLATARRADQARLVRGPTWTAVPGGATPAAEEEAGRAGESPAASATARAAAGLAPQGLTKPAGGAEAGGYVPPESPLSGQERDDLSQFQERSLAGPRATATALGLALAELAPRLTASPEGASAASAAEAEATWEAGRAALADLATLLGEDRAPSAAKAAGTAPEAAAASPSLSTAQPTGASATPLPPTLPPPALPATTPPSDPLARAWIPGLALMVALLALGLLAAVRARRGRRR